MTVRIRSFLLALGGLVLFGPSLISAASAQAPRTYPSDAMCKREQLCRQCTGPACLHTAAPIDWPSARLQAGTAPFVIGGHFRVSFPQGASLYAVLADGDVIAKYGAERWLSVQVLTAREANRPEWDGQRTKRAGALNFADVPRIQHTHTPDDAEPAHPDDRRLWRFALMDKGHAFKGATQLAVARHGVLTAYLSDATVAQDTLAAYVAHQRLPGGYLMLQAKGFSLDELRQVVASIESQRE